MYSKVIVLALLPFAAATNAVNNGVSSQGQIGMCFLDSVKRMLSSDTSFHTRFRIPDHAWYDCKPNISHLRIFGSLAYVNILKKLRGGKLEATSNKS